MTQVERLIARYREIEGKQTQIANRIAGLGPNQGELEQRLCNQYNALVDKLELVSNEITEVNRLNALYGK